MGHGATLAEAEAEAEAEMNRIQAIRVRVRFRFRVRVRVRAQSEESGLGGRSTPAHFPPEAGGLPPPRPCGVGCYILLRPPFDQS